MDLSYLYPVLSGLPHCMEWHNVGGISPPRGPRLPPSVGPRPHPSPYGPQALQDRLFPDDHVPLPGFGGDSYEDYYGAVRASSSFTSIVVVVSPLSCVTCGI